MKLISSGGDNRIESCHLSGGVGRYGANLHAIIDGSLTIVNSTFVQGTQPTAGGFAGGAYIETGGSTNIVDSDFISNTNRGAYVATGGPVHIRESTFSDNQGGGLELIPDGVAAVIESCVFDSNAGYDGAGAFVSSSGNLESLSVLNTSFTDNVSTGSGAAMYVSAGFQLPYTVEFSSNKGSGNVAEGGDQCNDIAGLGYYLGEGWDYCLAVDEDRVL